MHVHVYTLLAGQPLLNLHPQRPVGPAQDDHINFDRHGA
jgi:hypothetical protein